MSEPFDVKNTIPQESEVDLQHFSNRINGFYDRFIYNIYRLFRFLKRNKFVVLILLLIGGILGFFSDQSNDDRSLNEILVVPNFNSVEHLYNTVETFDIIGFNNELKASDNNEMLYSIKIEPVYDAYNFIISDRTHLKAFEILSDRSIDLEKYSKSKLASKNYKFHLLKIYTKGNGNTTALVDRILEKMNNDSYFNKRKEIEKVNTLNKRNELAKSIDLINGMFQRLGEEQKTSDLSLNSYNQVGDVLEIKEDLIRQVNATDVQLIEQDKIIYDASRIMNIKVTSLIPNIILFPFLFLVLFLIYGYLKSKFNRLKTSF